jgi:hypothetical protein
MLRVQNDRVLVVVKQVHSGNGLIEYPLLDGISVNSRIDYTITDLGKDTMLFSASKAGTTRQAKAPVPPAFRGATVRFQARRLPASERLRRRGGRRAGALPRA